MEKIFFHGSKSLIIAVFILFSFAALSIYSWRNTNQIKLKNCSKQLEQYEEFVKKENMKAIRGMQTEI